MIVVTLLLPSISDDSIGRAISNPKDIFLIASFVLETNTKTNILLRDCYAKTGSISHKKIINDLLLGEQVKLRILLRPIRQLFGTPSAKCWPHLRPWRNHRKHKSDLCAGSASDRQAEPLPAAYLERKSLEKRKKK